MLIRCKEALDPQDGCHSCQMREIFAHVLPNSQNFVRNVRNMTNVTNVNKSRLSWEHNSDSQNFTHQTSLIVARPSHTAAVGYIFGLHSRLIFFFYHFYATMPPYRTIPHHHERQMMIFFCIGM